MNKVMGDYEKFIHLSRYARWDKAKGRRESWEETVGRLCDFWDDRVPMYDHDQKDIYEAILNMEVMPSMRTLMTAGKALERDHVAGYNCAYLPVDHPRAFDEAMYILMCGTGVGFSVERQYIAELPIVNKDIINTDGVPNHVQFLDSKFGWADGFRKVLESLYSGVVPTWDLSFIRPAGRILQTFGGRSSGPEPLERLLYFTVEIFKGAAGRKLTSIECHDLMCKIAEVVVVGGVRRSALISLSNPSDGRMREAKSGQWWDNNGQRRLANNSACYTDKPDLNLFMAEWQSLYDSKSGERGFFSRCASGLQAGRNGRRDPSWDFGTNPCSEIILRPNQFCNLTEVVVRPDDTLATLKEKVRKATILGTLQATLVGGGKDESFKYLRPVWQKNTAEERLLGVSLTGIMDHLVLSGSGLIGLDDTDPDQGMCHWLREMKEVAIETNKEWAETLDIPEAAAITCVKPSGTVSQLVDSASGIHPRFSPYYIRRVRQDIKDPLTQFMIDQGFPNEKDITNPSNVIFSFPMKAPDGSITVDDVGPIDQLNLWEQYQYHWCEHKPSITVYYGDDNFLDVGAWLYKRFDEVSGVSFLPKADHVYDQAPYEEITEDEFKLRSALMPAGVNWSLMGEYEVEDNTTGTHELACTGGSCER